MKSTTVPDVGLFGKMPSHPDFVRLNAGGALPRALDRWMHEGLVELRQQAGPDWETRFDGAAPLTFVYRNGNAAEALVGVCVPGRDQSGRRYPLSVFTQATLNRSGRGFHLLGPGHAAFLDAAREMASDGSAGGAGEGYSQRILNLANLLPENLVVMERAFGAYLDDVTMASFWGGVFGEFCDRRKYLVTKNLFGALAPLRSLEPGRIKTVIRLPVAAGRNGTLTTAIWFLFCRAVLGDDVVSQATLFGQQGWCHLMFRAPGPMLLPPLFLPDLKAESVWDLEELGADSVDTAREALGDQIAGALDTPDLLMRDFLKRI